MNFKEFLIGEDKQADLDKKDIEDTIKILPKQVQALLKGYKISTQNGHTIKGDPGHIGFNDLQGKKLAVASPWLYPKQFAFLHECGHRVFAYLDKAKKQEWLNLAKVHKHESEKDPEEVFCHAFANHFSKNKMVKHSNEHWDNFIKSLF